MRKERRERQRSGFRQIALLAAALAGLSATEASADVRSISEVAPSFTTQSQAHAATDGQTRRVFVNLDGTMMASAPDGSPDDATRNETRMPELARKLDGYGGAVSNREAILQAVRADWADYNVVVTDRRPASGDYVMNHVGPNRPDSMGSKVLGIAHLDCGDRLMRNDVSFSFHDADDGHAPSSVAMTVSQEVAHAFGLEHVDDPNDVMFPARGIADPSFVDGCSPIVPAEGIGIACTDQHEDACGDPTLQNSHRELLALLGPSRADETPPSVEIATDFEALAVAPGDTFDLAVMAEDDVLVDRVVLYLEGEAVAEDNAAPFGWKMADVEPGEYEFYVEAVDMAGNASLSAPMTVYVGVEPPEGMDVGSPYADGEDIGNDAMVGCSCNTTSSGTDLGWGLMLLPLVWRRRR